MKAGTEEKEYTFSIYKSEKARKKWKEQGAIELYSDWRVKPQTNASSSSSNTEQTNVREPQKAEATVKQQRRAVQENVSPNINVKNVEDIFSTSAKVITNNPNNEQTKRVRKSITIQEILN
ncbi:hypothetical protein AKO1_003605 [Acrasis kona]|uniref:Uncharacterized protein n=1 Tax=Acrasis kona TaxID=1008807 RepID=A0AAW2Z5X1_9EUKA